MTVWPLPDAPHIPGATPRPQTSPAFEAALAAPARTCPDQWRDNRPYLYGFDLYANGYFWETHEVWEPVWMGCAPNSRERMMVQGLIQLANACLKIAMNRRRATERLLDNALDRLCEAGRDEGIVMGVHPAALCRDVLRFRRDISQESGPKWEQRAFEARPILALDYAV